MSLVVVPRDSLRIYDTIDTVMHRKTHQKVAWAITVMGIAWCAAIVDVAQNSSALTDKMLTFLTADVFTAISPLNCLFHCTTRAHSCCYGDSPCSAGYPGPQDSMSALIGGHFCHFY